MGKTYYNSVVCAKKSACFCRCQHIRFSSAYEQTTVEFTIRKNSCQCDTVRNDMVRSIRQAMQKLKARNMPILAVMEAVEAAFLISHTYEWH